MFLCKVICSVISQQKEPCLTGKKLLLCETAEGRGKSRLVAVSYTHLDVYKRQDEYSGA